MDRDGGKIRGRCLDGTADLVSLREAPQQAGRTVSSFPLCVCPIQTKKLLPFCLCFHGGF